ncbi:MAG TPA: GTP-binding protein, partial [Allocoleopsis sp.]
KSKDEFELKKEKEAAELKEKVKLQRKKSDSDPADPSKELKSKEPVQPTVNIGLVGHVDHGKTTLTEKLTGNGLIHILKK